MMLGIFVFIFIAWVATGGPSRPISFAGPFITPVTNVGVESKGYGSLNYNGVGSSIKSVYSAANTQTSVNSIQQKINDLKEKAVDSPAKGNVRIYGGDVRSSDAKTEYLTLSISGKDPIDITGWELVSTSTDETVRIPKGTKIGHVSDTGLLSNIVVSPGEQVILTTGRSPLSSSFKENSCGGYLAANFTFTPSISTYACPSPVDELRTYYTGDAEGYVYCKKYLETVYGCNALEDAPTRVPSSCSSFMNSELTYEGCVANHQNDSNFDGRTWRVYFEEKRDLWDDDHGTIYLLDKAGEVVDVYKY